MADPEATQTSNMKDKRIRRFVFFLLYNMVSVTNSDRLGDWKIKENSICENTGPGLYIDDCPHCHQSCQSLLWRGLWSRNSNANDQSLVLLVRLRLGSPILFPTASSAPSLVSCVMISEKWKLHANFYPSEIELTSQNSHLVSTFYKIGKLKAV